MKLLSASFKALINDTYDALEPLNNIGTTDYLDELYKLCYREEKKYRKGRTTCEFRQNKKTAAKYLAIKAFLIPKHFTTEDIMFINMSKVYGASLSANFQDKIDHDNLHIKRFKELYLSGDISYFDNISPYYGYN